MSPHRLSHVALWVTASVLAACTTTDPADPFRVVESVDGRHGRIEVLERRGSLALAVDGVFQTVVPPATPGIQKGLLLRGGDHVELVPYFRPGARSALLIGLGGGLEARALELYGLEVTAVEIDPEVVRLAKAHFGVTCQTVVADGRAFLEGSSSRHDAIVLDAFAGAEPPGHLFTREAFELLARRLTPSGLLVVHLVGRVTHRAVRAVARTVEEVLPHGAATRSGVDAELEAIYLFASSEPLELGPWVRSEAERLGLAPDARTEIDTSDASILTDAEGDLVELSRDVAEEHRRRSLEIRRRPPW